MKLVIRLMLSLLVVAAAAAAAYTPARTYWQERNRIRYRETEVVRGEVVAVVNSTGTVKPVLSVQIGAFVSGPIEELFVDFNDEVEEGDLLATIDPRIYEAAVARDQALLATRKAEVERVEAELQRATNDYQRAQALRAENRDYISDTEMDQYKFNRLALEAQLAVTTTAVAQAQANLDNSEANLAYTEIRSPVDGIVIERKIDPGQTLASQFQTPQLFVIAPEMRKEMHVFASVDEADIGLIRDAQVRERPVQFTVDAYPDELFEGKIFQVRASSTTTQNVVTYPVVVSTPNADLKLLPGMTASLSFEIDRKQDVLKVPNAALRFYPAREQVRPEHRKVLDGVDSETEEAGETGLPATEKATAHRDRNRRHVWVVDGEYLKPIEVTTGLSDYTYSELVSGELTEGQKLVTGIEVPE
jgi:HlyD family secretion protein